MRGVDSSGGLPSAGDDSSGNKRSPFRGSDVRRSLQLYVRYGCFDFFLGLSKGPQAPAENTGNIFSWVVVPHDAKLIKRREV